MFKPPVISTRLKVSVEQKKRFPLYIEFSEKQVSLKSDNWQWFGFIAIFGAVVVKKLFVFTFKPRFSVGLPLKYLPAHNADIYTSAAVAAFY